MADPAAGAGAGAGSSHGRVIMCKRGVVIFCALAHLAVTLYALDAMLEYSSVAHCFRGWNHFHGSENSLGWRRGRRGSSEAERVQAAMEWRRKAAPLLLILRVKDIEAEVVLDLQAQAQLPVPTAEITEEEEVEALIKRESRPQAHLPAVVDDARGAIQRHLLPPEKCQPEPNTDFGGMAVRWGRTHRVSNVAECCKACVKHAEAAREGQPKCNVWVYCPHKNGCRSPDGYEHAFGECWLKWAEKPKAVVGNYSGIMRDKSVPVVPVLWISGVLP